MFSKFWMKEGDFCHKTCYTVRLRETFNFSQRSCYSMCYNLQRLSDAHILTLLRVSIIAAQRKNLLDTIKESKSDISSFSHHSDERTDAAHSFFETSKSPIV